MEQSLAGVSLLQGPTTSEKALLALTQLHADGSARMEVIEAVGQLSMDQTTAVAPKNQEDA